jgi:hypothetical protein
VSNIVRGVALLARGKRAGLDEFAATEPAFSASIAPLIAFPLVGAALIGVGGHPKLALVAFLARFCAVLAQPVITQAFARLWGREAAWLRLAVALNWSFWLALPLLLLAAFVGAALIQAGVAETIAVSIGIGGAGAYLLWYHWFVARAALGIDGWRTALLVITTNLALGALTLGPDAVDWVVGHVK